MASSRGWAQDAHDSLLLCFIEEAVERSDNKKSLIQGVTERMKKAGYKYSYDAIKYCLFLTSPIFFLFSGHLIYLLIQLGEKQFILTLFLCSASMFKSCASPATLLASQPPPTEMAPLRPLISLSPRKTQALPLDASAPPPARARERRSRRSSSTTAIRTTMMSSPSRCSSSSSS